MDLGLKQRRAVVTGASRGIGRAIASALAAEGADVIAAARNAEKLQGLAASVQAGTGTITAQVADLSKEADIQGLAAELGKADILVFNTGGPPFGTAAEITDTAWMGQFEAMFLSAIRLTRLALPGMRARRFGRIMLVVSSGVIQPIPNLALSNALRSGLVGWAKTLASEVAADGVTVNCLAPGRIATDRIVEFDQARAKRDGTTEEQARKASLMTIPAGRYGEADEFAAMAAFLASPKASYMTGGIIRIDGGMIRSI
jgi:3-oxoacyl-[acyl-carrier protein] reductase